MYESFYGLNAKPFSMLPDPEFLYLGKKHRMALTLLEYALLNNAGFCVISGEIGAGKTTLLRKLLSTLENDITVGMITNTHQSFGELLDWVLSAFGIHQPGLGKVEMHQRFVDFLLEQYAKNKTTLLIVDEAQNMPATTLEELRMLSNINSEKDLVLQVVLAGQPDLKDKLRLPELQQFAQRISVDFHLDALDATETCHYIQHRLVTAGASDDIFTPQACRLIADYSGGVPRLINLLCDTALVYGFADQASTIDADLIEEMVSERMEHSILSLVKAEKGKKTSIPDDADFPWINPAGATKGPKPVAEKKTIKKTVAAVAQAVKTEADVHASQPIVDQAVEARAVAPVAERAELTTVESTVQGAAATQTQKPLRAVATSAGRSAGPVARRREARPQSACRAVKSDTEAEAEAEKGRFGNRMIVFALLLLGLFLMLTAVTYDYEVVVQDPPKSALAEREPDNSEAEIELLKQDLSRVQRQAEDMQRARDAALVKAQEEQKLRVHQAQAAEEAARREQEAARREQEAAKREQEAISAAEQAAERALVAEQAADRALELEQQADALSQKQRLEIKKLLDERAHFQKERQRAESQEKLLKEQRQIIVLEWERLANERAKLEQALPDWSDSE